MKARIKIISVFALLSLVCLATSACGMKVKAGGRVVDANTGQPIEGAVVGIYWVHYKLGPPGMPTPKDRIGTTETLTDVQGDFSIPRYLWRSHYMGVYKKGYICWNSEDIFNPYGKTYEQMYPKRDWQGVNNNMLIELEPIPTDISAEQLKLHGCFAGSVDTRLKSTKIFSEAIQNENELCFKKSNLKSKGK